MIKKFSVATVFFCMLLLMTACRRMPDLPEQLDPLGALEQGMLTKESIAENDRFLTRKHSSIYSTPVYFRDVTFYQQQALFEYYPEKGWIKYTIRIDNASELNAEAVNGLIRHIYADLVDVFGEPLSIYVDNRSTKLSSEEISNLTYAKNDDYSYSWNSDEQIGISLRILWSSQRDNLTIIIGYFDHYEMNVFLQIFLNILRIVVLLAIAQAIRSGILHLKRRKAAQRGRGHDLTKHLKKCNIFT
ncbi:MAG: hypothetical protein ACOX88_05005 [Christensenellales bacterium]